MTGPRTGAGDGAADSVRGPLLGLWGRVERHAAASLTVRARAGSRPVLVTWRPQALTAVLTPRALEDPMLSAVWGENLTRLALVVPSTRQGVIDIRVEVDE